MRKRGRMLQRVLVNACVCMYLIVGTTACKAQNLDLARDFYQHNLLDKAKELAITIVHDKSSSSAAKAEALYLLGQISFEEKRYSVALEDWSKLIKAYPESPQAKEIEPRLAQLREVFAKASEETVLSAVAISYLENGDFWFSGSKVLTIDNSWLPNVELATQWYDRVIKEFPGSTAAEKAYSRKLLALLGWKELGEYSSAYGTRASFAQYMPLVLQTYAQFERDFPNSSHLQAFRYQIAQAYWGQKDWTNSREWLQKIIDAAHGEQTFYTETATARLSKLQY